MELLGTFFAIGLLVAIGILWPQARATYAEWRNGRGAELSDAEHCWLCGTDAPERVELEVYRCRACGGVQGENAAQFLAAERRRTLTALPHAERLSRAGGSLEEARLGLVAVQTEIKAAVSLSNRAKADRGDHAVEDDARSFLATALMRLGQNERLLDDAAILLGQEPASMTDAISFNSDISSRIGQGYDATAHAFTRCERLSAELDRQLAR